MKIKLGEDGIWEDMYVTFDYCVIFYSTVKPQFIKGSGEEIDEDDDSTKVYMDKVISLRTDVRSPILDCGVSDCPVFDMSSFITSS